MSPRYVINNYIQTRMTEITIIIIIIII